MDVIVGAVVGEAINRSSSFLDENFTQHTRVEKKLRRMDNLLIKIHSAVAVSEKVNHLSNDPLRRWQARLNETAVEGTEAANIFRDQSGIGATSSSNAAKRRIKRCIFGDATIAELDNSLEKLEEASRDLGDFLRILKFQLQIHCAKRKQRRARKSPRQLC